VPQLAALLGGAGLEICCWVEPLRYDPMIWLPDPKLRARAEVLDPIDRAALAEALTGNISTHVVYCRRAAEPWAPADVASPDAVPITREMPGEEMTKLIRADGGIPYLFDGLRTVVALPPLAGAILRLVDGSRTVGEIVAALAQRGTAAEAVTRAWRATFTALNRANQLLLAPPP